MAGHVFICYARQDSDFVVTLAGHLREAGIPVWLDHWSIAPGADWNAAIAEAIHSCANFLAVLSPALTTSDVARQEWTLALMLQKPIVPVGHLPCDLPPELARYQLADFVGRQPGDRESLPRLVAVLTGAPLPPPPLSLRQKFLAGLQEIPPTARAFDADCTKEMTVDLTRRLSDGQFLALHDLRVAHDRYDRRARGIVESLALERIGGAPWGAREVWRALQDLGFVAPAADPRERNHPDPGYDYTALFWGYTNLLRYLNVGDLEPGTAPLGSAYWLSPPEG
jgi:hypothetical protein